MENKGIIVTGNGSFDSVNTTTGDNSHIHVEGSAIMNKKNELQKTFDELIQKINSAKEDIPDKEDTISQLQMLQSEVKKEQPNKQILKIMGKTILENLKYVKDLAPLATSMWHHIVSLLT